MTAKVTWPKGPRRQFTICSSLHHLPFINSLNGPGITAKHNALLHCAPSLPHSVEQSWPVGLLFKSIPTVSKGAGGYMSPVHITQSDSFLQLFVTGHCSSKKKLALQRAFLKRGFWDKQNYCFNFNSRMTRKSLSDASWIFWIQFSFFCFGYPVFSRVVFIPLNTTQQWNTSA